MSLRCAAQPQSVGLIAGTVVSGVLAAVIFALLVIVTLFYWRNKNRYEDDDIPNEIRCELKMGSSVDSIFIQFYLIVCLFVCDEFRILPQLVARTFPQLLATY